LAKAKTELTDPIAFLRATYPNEKLWRFVLTHPDLDHMRGLKRLHDVIGFHVFWDTNHTKPTPEYRSGDDKVDWEFYQTLRNDPRRRRYHRGDALFAFAADEYGNPGGDNIQILSPTPALLQACDAAEKSNDLSIVLRLWHAGKSVLLPGDAEKAAWESMTAHFGPSLKSDYLKASHHGRDTGYNLDAVKLVAPAITFVSVGRKPDTDASSKYRQQCNKVASTRYHGNMELRIHDDSRVEWFVDRNWD
jgi:beta-lactamase superfamily II metal-dependent hydrolase